MEGKWANQAAPVNAPIAPWFQIEHAWRRVTELRRSGHLALAISAPSADSVREDWLAQRRRERRVPAMPLVVAMTDGAFGPLASGDCRGAADGSTAHAPNQSLQATGRSAMDLSRDRSVVPSIVAAGA